MSYAATDCAATGMVRVTNESGKGSGNSGPAAATVAVREQFGNRTGPAATTTVVLLPLVSDHGGL